MRPRARILLLGSSPSERGWGMRLGRKRFPIAVMLLYVALGTKQSSVSFSVAPPCPPGDDVRQMAGHPSASSPALAA